MSAPSHASVEARVEKDVRPERAVIIRNAVDRYRKYNGSLVTATTMLELFVGLQEVNRYFSYRLTNASTPDERDLWVSSQKYLMGNISQLRCMYPEDWNTYARQVAAARM